MKTYNFPDVSLLITHYNRSESLDNLLSSFKKLNCEFGEIVVSDDGSKPAYLEKLKELEIKYNFKLVTTPVNKGLGNNINKGQDAVTCKYTLYVQEDFEPKSSFPDRFSEAVKFMDDDSKLDLVRFYAYAPYAYLEPFNEFYSSMRKNNYGIKYKKIYFYSDHPHLRRSDFFNKFGRYPEGIKGDLTEYKMCISFLQNDIKGLFYTDYKGLFDQINSAAEPSTMTNTRSNWRQGEGSLIGIIRNVYRQLKYNYDIHTMKPLKKVKD
ncbi:glycosyltransferase family 2 protein [Pedobacter sp. MR2016-24]|uniref:glycosyltransferase family 2 protein n=1 Tax=Pedobacter sp. MR2016-24 TaxID=2994466 RepID=UPI002247D718|nr:glycosyltransferase family 2 protein [Pedobacter sp. MR2016-24]MCX2484231.1 glycosyltransferase family 2 protein [Pedobacter sp. MR2016-24]